MPDSQNTIRTWLVHSFYLVLTILLIWFWTNNLVLSAYSLQLTGILVVFYFASRFLAKGNKEIILDVIVFIAILLLVLASTGGLGSPLFFLIYFLLFAVALLFDPPTTLTLTLALTLFFANSLTSTRAALQLLSLVFITPLAIYFGKQYLRLLEAQEKIKILAKKSKELAAVSNQQSANLANEETNTLLWLSLNFKNSLLQIIHLSSELLADLGHLTLNQKERLQSIHESAKELLKSGEKLKEKIDKETD
ncbi:MAG: hypothetical protein ACPLY7_00775 [Microgenomates group bacterium]